MALCMLIRHASAENGDKVLLGRRGQGLSAAGRLRAFDLGCHFARSEITHIFSSPQRRALETAAPISRQTGLAVSLAHELDEIDFGAWTGRKFDELEGELMWLLWNEARASARPPEGESMLELQVRVVRFLERYAAKFPRGRAVMISHAEPIRALALACMSLPLDDWAKIDVPPGGMITVGVGPAGQMILSRRAAA